MNIIKMKSPYPNKELRPDFDYDCECGFYVCDCCGYSMYPMEIDTTEDNYDYCPKCEGDMVKYVKH